MSAEQNEQPKAAPHPRFNTAEARQKAEFILSRAFGLVKNPKAEWEQIRDEETTIPNIVLGYVAPLALIPPVCDLIGRYVFGTRIGAQVIRPHLDQALTSAALTVAVSIALIFFLGLLISALAENFDGERNDLQGQKVAAYAMTPTFFSGFFSLWPGTWWVALFALGYAVYLFYLGLPTLMKAPRERAVGYAATVSIGGLIALIVLFALAGCLSGAGRV
ncbi:MAG TPA: Yip1 family protein [Caulobacterales bacterium]|nr:Yip1 family protein [Caulobacterales bacterium]